MKHLIRTAILTAAIFPTIYLNAQNSTKKTACTDPTIIHQADSIKQELTKLGFVIVKEATMNMRSEDEMPVIVPLNEGSMYQFVFIADATSKSYEVRMFDWHEKEVAFQKKQKDNSHGNVISYSYVPNFSEYHLIKPLQVNGEKKSLCGYVMLLKKIRS